MKRALSVCTLLCAAVMMNNENRCSVAAQPDAKQAASNLATSSHAPAGKPPELCVTRHSIVLGGKPLPYVATAGALPIINEQGKSEAQIFFVAYVKEGGASSSRRPITFAFNGGPGASSIWLHIGGLGPKRTPLADDGTALPQTYQLVDNDATWLDFTDLVFVDPVGTGYSRAAPGVDPKQFFEVDRDARTAARFIRLYLTQFDRWLSPKLIVGESYGSTRAAMLLEYLQSDDGINLNGEILISSAIDFQTFSFSRGNDLAYVLGLPSYTAAAWYHKRLSPRLQANLPKTLAEVEHWAVHDYLPALAEGDALPAAGRKRVADALAEYTGLSPTFLEESDLRVANLRFTKELLRGRQQKIGLLDGRVVGADVAPWSDHPNGDPALFLATGPLVATLNHYLRNELGYRNDLPYEYLSEAVNRSWQWGSAAGGYLNLSGKLKQAATSNPHLRIFMAAGYFDLTTPYFSQQYTLSHLELAPSLRTHVSCHRYASGHQIYNSAAPMRAMKADVAAFIKEDLP